MEQATIWNFKIKILKLRGEEWKEWKGRKWIVDQVGKDWAKKEDVRKTELDAEFDFRLTKEVEMFRVVEDLCR